MTQSYLFFFEIFLALKTTLCHCHKFSLFILSFRTRKPDGGRVLHVTGDDLGEEWSSAAAEGRQLERRVRIGLPHKHRGAVHRAPSGALPHQRRDS